MKQWLKNRLKLPKIIPKMPYISDESKESFARETGLILFFCMFGYGLWLVDRSLCFIICGLMGMWFTFPRAGR